ncbi:uncharacterized protein VTP21DRAFT_10360 [Calcarisporiella thermophila]|uniref:uncharacterized protein n=1 Tax=Calcarisporiella thermophila TaxID=911321 RepID=UPI0037428B4A
MSHCQCKLLGHPATQGLAHLMQIVQLEISHRIAGKRRTLWACLRQGLEAVAGDVSVKPVLAVSALFSRVARAGGPGDLRPGPALTVSWKADARALKPLYPNPELRRVNLALFPFRALLIEAR